MTLARLVLAASAVLLVLSPAARAHVAPADDANNRYIKLTPMSDRLRIAYTVFLGHRPGAQLRRELDRDGDGRVGDDESRRYGDAIAARVADTLHTELDGTPAPVTWTEVSVGLGSPEVTAGAFSVDLIGWICAAPGPHQVAIRHAVTFEPMGETELRIEVPPHFRLGERTLGGEPWTGVDATWTGANDPLVRGVDLSWSSDAPGIPASACLAPPRTGDHRRRWALAATAVGAIAAGILLRRRLTARRASAAGR